MPSDPCHARPFVQPGIVVRRGDAKREEDAECVESPVESRECCDYCGSRRLEWRKCKLVCTACRQINKSCADL
jgi:hypothetical protein